MTDSTAPINVLHVDDDSDFVELAATYLEREEELLNVKTAVTPDDAVEILETEDIDCIVSDHDMPGRSGIELLRNVREDHPDLPFILFTGKGSEEVASEAISEGVTDYLQKRPGTEQYALLANKIRNAVEQYRASKAVKAAEEWTSTLLEHSSDYLFVVDGSGTVSYVSPSVERVMGYEQAEVVGSSAFEFVHPEDTDQAIEAFSELIEHLDGEVTVKFRAKHGDGDYRWIQVRGRNLLDDNTVEGVLVNVRDITVIEEQNRAFESFLEIVNDQERPFDQKMQDVLDLGRAFLDVEYGIISRIDPPEYHVEHVSTPDGSIAAGDRFEYKDTYCELVFGSGEPVAFRSPDEGGVQAHPCYREMGLEAYLGQLLLVDGKPFGTLNFSSPTPRERTFGSGEIAFIRTMAEWVGKEIGRQQNLDQIEAQQAELEAQNERLEQFASFVSHDLRNPLSVAQGRIQLAQEEFGGENLERARRALERSHHLIDDLLAIARDQDDVSVIEDVDLAELAERCWGYVETAEATLDISTNAKIQADPGRLQQLLENLFRNAIEHGGLDVTVTVGDIDGGFYVEDDGPGIPEANREQVFEMGFSTEGGGTGLGLNIVAEIAEAHGWSVRLGEAQSGGARFEVIEGL